jgi:hypothetical protein
MCLAIYQPAGKEVPESHLAAGFKNNPHGAGFMYFDENGALRTFKSMGYSEFIDEYEKQWALHGQYSPFAIHFRWATHGTNGIENVHPFRLSEHVAVLHNGIIDCIIKDERMSDTAAFVRDYLGALPKNWYDNEFLFEMVEEYTSGSKLVVMTNEPGAEYCAYILNERLGNWIDGSWYSNGSYCTYKPLLTSNTKAMTLYEDEDIYKLEACQLCGEESVLDFICYTCESCQECFMTEGECVCDGSSMAEQLSLHAMSEQDFIKHYSV